MRVVACGCIINDTPSLHRPNTLPSSRLINLIAFTGAGGRRVIDVVAAVPVGFSRVNVNARSMSVTRCDCDDGAADVRRCCDEEEGRSTSCDECIAELRYGVCSVGVSTVVAFRSTNRSSGAPGVVRCKLLRVAG